MAEFDTANATATADDILNGKTAYVKGEKIKGTIPSKLGGTFTPTTEPQVICPAGVYTSSAFSIKGDANLKPTNIRKGVEIFGVEGTMRGNDTPSGTLPDNMKTINVAPNIQDAGTVHGGGAATEGMFVTVSAVPKGKYNCFGWEEKGETVSEDAEYTFQVTAHRNLTALFGDTHKPLPDGYTEVEWIQNLNTSSYINIGKTIGTTFSIGVSFPKGIQDLSFIFYGGNSLRTGSPKTFHWYYYANAAGTSSFLTQRTLNAGESRDGITGISFRKSSGIATLNSISINGTSNSFQDSSSLNASDITIPSEFCIHGIK